MFSDTHCHLSCIETDKNALAEHAIENSVSLVIDISTGLDDFITRMELARGLSQRYPIEVYVSAGIPPYYADRRAGGDIETLRSQCLEGPIVVALGEIGLDYFHDYGTKKEQKRLFIEQIELADEMGLPVVVHSRDSDDDLLEILKNHTPGRRGVIHCFSSEQKTASGLLDLGFFLSFAGNITYKRSENIREVARSVPSDSYLVETDAPYLPPETRRGRPNEPANVAIVARFIAGLRGETAETVAETTTANARRIFGLRKL